MAEITAEVVKTLREKTGAGMMDCKKALAESNGDMEKAIDYLRKKGASVAAKRSDRDAKEGLIVSQLSTDGKSGVIVEVNCETDFVSRNEVFGAFAENVTKLALSTQSKSADAVLAQSAPFTNGIKVSEFINEIVGKTGEKVDVRRVAYVSADKGVVIDYIHPGSKLGVLVVLESEVVNDTVKALGKDLAMQVAAANPMVVTREKVDTSKINAELDIYKTMARNEKKPEAVIEKIATGKLEKFYEENVLIEQKFVKDPTKSIKTLIEETSKAVGKPITVVHFERILLGENI